jgi:hypothetical protein
MNEASGLGAGDDVNTFEKSHDEWAKNLRKARRKKK